MILKITKIGFFFFFFLQVRKNFINRGKASKKYKIHDNEQLERREKKRKKALIQAKRQKKIRDIRTIRETPTPRLIKEGPVCKNLATNPMISPYPQKNADSVQPKYSTLNSPEPDSK